MNLTPEEKGLVENAKEAIVKNNTIRHANGGMEKLYQHFCTKMGRASVSYANTSNNLIYNGGPVMGGTTQVYAIFWEPTGSYVSPS